MIDNTDLVYVLDNAVLKEYIILENENAPNAFSFLFSMDGLTMQTGEDTAAFRDAADSCVSQKNPNTNYYLGEQFLIKSIIFPMNNTVFMIVPVFTI